MKPEDIIVGRSYKHRDFPDYVYIGIGQRHEFVLEEYTAKYLLIPEKNIIVRYRDNDNFWDGFSLFEETMQVQYKSLAPNDTIGEEDYFTSNGNKYLKSVRFWGWIGKQPSDLSSSLRFWRMINE